MLLSGELLKVPASCNKFPILNSHHIGKVSQVCLHTGQPRDPWLQGTSVCESLIDLYPRILNLALDS